MNNLIHTAHSNNAVFNASYFIVIILIYSSVEHAVSTNDEDVRPTEC